MLALSLVIVLVLLAGAGIALDVALRLWTGGGRRPANAGALLLPALRLLPALALFAIVWWIGQAAGARVEASRGAITAAIIARTGWADPEIVFTTARWIATFVAWVVGPLIALALFGALTRGRASGEPGRWLRPALSWRALAVGALVVLVLAWFWPALDGWRPALPASRVQLVFVGAKIAAGLTALALALATFIRLAALGPDPAPPASPHDPAQRQAA